MKRLLISGGRDYKDREVIYTVLDHLHLIHKFSALIYGCASGADNIGRDWAILRGIPTEPFPADWDEYGDSAGSIRNLEMLDQNPDILVYFRGNVGTNHCRTHALGKILSIDGDKYFKNISR